MAVSGMIVAVSGCGSDPQAQSAAPAVTPGAMPIPSVEPVRAEQVTGEPQAGDVESTMPQPASPDRLAKQAEEHARAIEALLAAREAEQDQVSGVRVIAQTPNTPTQETTRPQTQTPTQTNVRVDPTPQKPVEIAFADPEPTQTPIEVTTQPPMQGASVQSPPVTVQATEPVAGSMSRANTPMRVTNDPPSEIVVQTQTQTPAQNGSMTGVMTGASGVDAIEQQLARRAREYPRDLPSQLDYQLLLFTKDEQVPRNADLAGLASEDRELLTALVDGLTNFRNSIRADNNMLMNRKIRPIVEMSDRLRSRADLSIPNAMLCREVKGFGMYTPIESTRFEAGKAHKVIVYSEVENFASVLNDKSLWETRLEQELVLYTESGLPVWEEKTPTTDFCRNRRRDFFVARIVTIPANLTMGRYVLKVSVTDQQASRIAETSIPIAVVAK
jgi:hypothetical protein